MTPAGSIPAVHLLRCNPYGHSTGPGGDAGPRHLLGGLYGPQYEGPKKWQCENPADGWWRMTCACGHRGQKMPLCYPHVQNISRRQAGICPPCVMPAPALELHEAIQRASGQVAAMAGLIVPRELMAAAVARYEDLSRQMTELYERGIIHKCPLTLTEIS